MAPKQDISVTANNINAVISSVLSSQVISQGTSYSSITKNTQIILNSDSCTNSMNLTSNKTIIVNTQIFSDQMTYQRSVSDIANQVSQAVEEALEGGVLPSQQKEQVKSLIASVVMTSLTSKQMNLSQTSTEELVKNTQICVSSSNSNNTLIGDSTMLMDALYRSYSTNKSVQDTSVLIKNILDQKATATKTGALVGIIDAVVWGLVALCAILAIIAIIAVSVYVLTLLKL
jgi:hypothetical protein